MKTLFFILTFIMSFTAHAAISTCPSGWTKSADGLTCVLETKTTQTPNQASNTAKPVCISGYAYSSTSMKCEQNTNASQSTTNKTYAYMSSLRFGPNPQEECPVGYSNPKTIYSGVYCFAQGEKRSQVFYGSDYTATPYYCDEGYFPYDQDWGTSSTVNDNWFNPNYLDGGTIVMDSSYYNAYNFDRTFYGFSSYTNWFARYIFVNNTPGYYTFSGVADDQSRLYINGEGVASFDWNINYRMYFDAGSYEIIFKIVNTCPDCGLSGNPTSLNVMLTRDSDGTNVLNTYMPGWKARLVDEVSSQCYAMKKVR
jgi:hypothetical protein